mmetsp:Transcript_327/g.461  ORF Transcript_327/g.461 Transcript_327/m.461 type:complete len:721 (+) Transcript_327:685-2847(+)
MDFRCYDGVTKKKTLVPCTLRVDGQNYEHFLFQQNAVRVKRYYFHDIESVSKGYVSPFLKQYVESTDSEKTLSIYFRDRRRGGKRKSVDLVFIGNTGTAVNKSKFPGRQRNTKSASDEFENKGDQDHKARMDRNRFYNNLKLLINELESDDAFFFGSTGAYCRVGTSIFERWERVTMIDPNWEPVDTQRLLLEYRVSQAKPNDDTTNRKKKKGMYKPWPLSEKHKPQNAEPFNVIYRWSRTQKKDNRTRQYAACWYSETVEIDYGDYADMLEVSQKWFKNPMRKEVFMLQRCKLVNSSGREVVAEEHLLNSELPSVELPPDMYWKPEFIHERKHSMRNPYSQKGRLGSPGHRPAQVKLVEMKEHYEKEVRRLWGTIGVTGWRNCVTGEFDFEDVDWRKLIKMAREKKLENGVLDTVATYAADELENAMNTYEDTPMVISSTNANIEDSHEAQQQRKKKKSSHDALVHCRITLLKRLWSIQGVPTEEIHKKGRMWLTRRKQTYNTAQKAAFTKSMLTSPPLSKDEVLKEAKIENIAKRTGIHVRRDGKTSGSGPRVLPGCKIELRVLELNKRKPYSLPLGLRVTRFRDPGEGFRVTSRKREVSIIATVGLRVVGVEANVLASIDSAWQVRTIQKGDILVAVNGRTGSSIPELVKLTQLGKTPRILTFYRIDDPSTMSLSVNYDDEGQESSSSEDKKDNDGNAGTSIDNEDEYDFAEHVILL